MRESLCSWVQACTEAGLEWRERIAVGYGYGPGILLPSWVFTEFSWAAGPHRLLCLSISSSSGPDFSSFYRLTKPVCVRERHSGNTCRLGRGRNGWQPRLEALLLSSPPCLAQLSGPPWTVSWVWGNRLGVESRRSLWAPRGYGIGGQLIVSSQDPMAFCN